MYMYFKCIYLIWIFERTKNKTNVLTPLLTAVDGSEKGVLNDAFMKTN